MSHYNFAPLKPPPPPLKLPQQQQQPQQYIHNIRRNNCLPFQQPQILSNNNNNNHNNNNINNNTKYHIVPIKTGAQSYVSCLRNNNRSQQCYSLPLSLSSSTASPPQTIFEMQPESDEQSFDAINIVNPVFSSYAANNNKNHSLHAAVEIVSNNNNKIEINDEENNVEIDIEPLNLNYSAIIEDTSNLVPITLNDCCHNNFNEINYADDETATASAVDEHLVD